MKRVDGYVSELDKDTHQLADEIEREKKISKEWLSLVEDGADLIAKKLPSIVQVVTDIVTAQSKLVIGSGSKSFKTWLTMDMALSIAHGVQWWDRQTIRLPVLYVNLELRPESFARRLQILTQAKEIKLEPNAFLHLPLRGKLGNSNVIAIVDQIIALALSHKRKVIVLDPVYKMNLQGEENNSRDQTIFFNQLDRMTLEAECTVILNDHFSKGNQAEKDPLDAIRGSSAKGGDVDAAIVLRRHDVQDCFRVDVIHRELPPVEPFCIGWRFPLMKLRPDLDPENMKKPKGGRSRTHDPRALLKPLADGNPISISGWADDLGMPRQTLTAYLPSMRVKGWISTVGDGNAARQIITEKGLEILRQLEKEDQ